MRGDGGCSGGGGGNNGSNNYVGREHAEHLASILSEQYKCLHDWDGQWYLGMNIDWDYT